MYTIGQLSKNISSGQSAIPTKAIFNHLHNIYLKLQPKIKIVKAEQKNNGTLIYLLVPSESMTNIFYNVVFWFDTTKQLTNNTKFKVYSNSPAFGYSYAYLFNKNGSLLFPAYYPLIMLSEPPKIRNPFSVTFDKHVYSALIFLHKTKLDEVIKNSQTAIQVSVDKFENKMSQLKKFNQEKTR